MARRKVDTIRSQLTPEQARRFDELCRNRPTGLEVWNLLREWGYKIHLDTVREWYHDFFPVGKEAKKQHEMMLKYTGVQPLAVEEYATVRLLALVERMYEVMDEVDEDDFRKNHIAIFDKLPGYIHQLRGLASSLKETKRTAPSQEVALAVMEEVLQEFAITFKDSPLEVPIATASRGARQKIAEKWGT